jgi:hypothetical protein
MEKIAVDLDFVSVVPTPPHFQQGPKYDTDNDARWHITYNQKILIKHRIDFYFERSEDLPLQSVQEQEMERKNDPQ